MFDLIDIKNNNIFNVLPTNKKGIKNISIYTYTLVNFVIIIFFCSNYKIFDIYLNNYYSDNKEREHWTDIDPPFCRINLTILNKH